MFQGTALSRNEGVSHGFMSRRGGVSEGIYASLNCGPGSSDRLDRVIENRARALIRLGAGKSPLCTVHQVHGRDVVTVDKPWPMNDAPKADAMVTDRPGIVLGILTADCVPVLLADRDARVIGAAHAGWKGARQGVIAATLEAMTALGAETGRVTATVGPAIAQRSYEVGPEVRQAFVGDDPAASTHFAPSGRAGHFLFDLGVLVMSRLRAAGVGTIERLDHDTLAEDELFFSYRRATKTGEPDYGRCLSAILIEP